MRNQSFWVGFLLCVTMLSQASAMGDERMRIKVDQKKLTSGQRYAVIAFCGNSVVTGNMGLGSLVTGALANKEKSGNASLDEAYFNSIYDGFVNTMKNEGYNIVAAADLVSNKAYQDATALEMPSFKNAKGLKNINSSKPEALTAIAGAVGADYLFHITLGHSLGMRSNIGLIAGKQVGISNATIVVFDATGKKLGYIDASDISDQRAGAVAGGFSDPSKVIPMLEEADRKLIAKVAAKISKNPAR